MEKNCLHCALYTTFSNRCVACYKCIKQAGEGDVACSSAYESKNPLAPRDIIQEGGDTVRVWVPLGVGVLEGEGVAEVVGVEVEVGVPVGGGRGLGTHDGRRDRARGLE